VEALFYQAKDRANALQWDEAIELYDRALELDLSLPRAHKERGEAYFFQGLAFSEAGRRDLSREAFAHAAADFTRALDLGYLPQADAYYNRSLAHLVAGDFDRAIQDASKATELDSNDSEGWSSRSYAFYQRGLTREMANRLEDARSDYQEAITSATRALERKPSSPGAVLNNRALSYESLGDMDHAMTDLRQAAKAEPGSAITLSELCKRGSLWGRAPEVLPWCDRAVALEPDNLQWRDRRGIARALAGDLQGAAEDFAVFLRWAEKGYPVPEVLASRRAWLAALRAGRNPFDAKTLKRLRYE
jgi:tetratricopeptide (TPR) repeat protein